MEFETENDKMAVNHTDDIKSRPSLRHCKDPHYDGKQYSSIQDLTHGEEKDIKDQDASNSFRNLMEYREAPASPSASSVTTTLSLENLGSPTTPVSPPPPPVQEMDDERLPNELLDEICEDIGMKEGMELDFVEFLMEQDMVDPQTYMTQEAIMNSGMATPVSQSASMSTTPVNKTSEMVWTGRNCGSPSTSYSVTSSTNVTVATSSGSSSPASKRFHASTSGPPSPAKLNRPQSPQGSGSNFKAPQTPPTARRPSKTFENVSSPSSTTSSSQATTSNSTQSTVVPNRCYSPSTSQISCSQTGQQKMPPNYGQTAGQNGAQPQATTPRSSCPSVQKSTGYQRLGRPAPPNVNVQNMSQGKWMGPQGLPGGMNHGQPSCAMGNSNNMGYPVRTQQFNPRMESPLDQGYYSGDTASVRSYGSTVSSNVPSTLSSVASTCSMPQMQGQNHLQQIRQHRPAMHSPTTQKSVHFADMPRTNNNGVPLQRQRSNDGMGYGPGYDNAPDCGEIEGDFMDNSQKAVQSKILPRLSTGIKSEIAPYTVPNNGQPSMNAYGEFVRNPNNMGQPSPSSISIQQQYDFKQQADGEMFGMDNNQNIMQMNNFNQSQSSCAGGPMGLQQAGYRGPNSCAVNPDPSKGSMYNIHQQTDYYKQMEQMGQQEIFGEGNQYHMPGQGGMNESCSMMGMNPGTPRMMGPQQVQSGSGYSQQQCFQGNNNGQNYGQPLASPCANVAPRQLHMTTSTPLAGHQGNMGGSAGYEQSPYGQVGRMQQGSVNMYQSGAPQTPNMGPQQQPWAGTTPQTPQMKDMTHGAHPKAAQPGMHPLQTMQTPVQSSVMPPGQSPMGPCTIPNCNSCKTGSPHRPPMLSSQQSFIQHLITDRSNAFRSHPLFPLLRDLIIADMNFSSPQFPYQLISNLPAEFDKLLQNFLQRNPPNGNYQSNFAVESVVMDALKYAHACLIEKIRSRQDQDKHTKSTSKSLSAIEEFCEKFDRSVRNSIIKPATLNLDQTVTTSGNAMGSPVPGQTMMADSCSITPVGTPSKDKYSHLDSMMHQIPGLFGSPIAKKGLDMGMASLAHSPQFKSLRDITDNISDTGSAVSSSSNHSNKTESKKHPSLPKEAVAMMLDWLRQHKDNPYPNDDEKAMLIKQTGLTINQINYWFTNARRRILPKWAQQCKT